MKRRVKYLLLIVLTSLLLFKGIVPAWNVVHSDFSNYYVSSRLVISGTPLDRLYDNTWFQQKIDELHIACTGKFAPFPPVTAWMMVPLASLDILTAQRIFLIINLLFIGLGIYLIQRMLHWPTLDCTLLVLGCGLGLINNIAFGQVYWIMTVCLLLAVFWERNNLIIPAAVLLALFTSLKYFPIVMMAGFFLIGMTRIRRPFLPDIFFIAEVKLAAYSLLALGIIIFLQFVFFGQNVMQEFIQQALLPHLDGELVGQGRYSFHYQSWDNFFRNLCTYDPEFNPHPYFPWDGGRTILKLLVEVLILCSVAGTLFQFRTAENRIRTAVFIAVPSLAALALLPASATYHFTLLVVPLVVLLSVNIFNKKESAFLLTLFALIGFIPYSLAFHWGKEWNLLLAYPRLWLVTFLYVAVIVVLHRRRWTILVN